MNKEMRKELKDKGLSVPRSNVDAQELYDKTFSVEKPVVVKLVSNNVFTYIGSGDEPPHMVNFMGKQQFVRGKAVEVTDPEVIEKIVNNPCFVRGEADQKLMFDSDEKAKKQASAQRVEDKLTNAAALRQRA